MSSTGAGGSSPAIDLAAARAFLSARAPDVADVAPLRRGEWSSAYAFRRGGAEYVVRFNAFREDFEKDRLAARHRSPALPMPRVVEVGEALGVHYAVTERARGAYLEALDATELRRALPALFAALDAMREADVSATSGFGGWGADGNAPHPTWAAALLDVATAGPGARARGWRAHLETRPAAARAFDEGVEALRGLVDRCPNERHLVHGDLVYYNVLVSDGRISAVLDWGSSSYGDFLYDVAWLAFWAPWYPNWEGVDLAAEAERHFGAIGLTVPGSAERLRCCALHIGLGGVSYAAWRGRWDEVDRRVPRVLALARGARR